jgi:predicted nuclease of predicted toxin-antitoxin system
MRFLADENFPVPSIRRLRAADHDVAAIIEDSPGIEDTVVLARAAREDRFLLTLDRDYGALIYLRGLLPPVGVLYFRIEPRMPDEPAERLLRLLREPDRSFEGLFTTVDDEQVRQRPLP